MRNIKLLIAGISAAILVTGCGVTQDGFSSNSLQKRKYTKGFYISKRSHLKAKNDDSKNEVAVENTNSQVSEEAAVILKKRDLKQISTTGQVVVQEREAVRTDAVKVAQPSVKTEKEHTVKEVAAAKSEKQTTAGVSKEHKQVSKDQKRAVRDILKQKFQSHSSMDDFQLLCVILTILIPFVGVAVYTNLDLTKTLICLLLTLLLYVPGLIYGLLVVLDKI